MAAGISKGSALTAFFREVRNLKQVAKPAQPVPPVRLPIASEWGVLESSSIVLAWPKGMRLTHVSGGFTTTVENPLAWSKLKTRKTEGRRWQIALIPQGTLMQGIPIMADEESQASDPLAGRGIPICRIDDFTFPEMIRCVVTE